MDLIHNKLTKNLLTECNKQSIACKKKELHLDKNSIFGKEKDIDLKDFLNNQKILYIVLPKIKKGK